MIVTMIIVVIVCMVLSVIVRMIILPGVTICGTSMLATALAATAAAAPTRCMTSLHLIGVLRQSGADGHACKKAGDQETSVDAVAVHWRHPFKSAGQPEDRPA